MSDGGDGFGSIVAKSIKARPQRMRTINAAHEKVSSTWWWQEESNTAIIESALVIGLAMLPPGKFHPFHLDTAGLGEMIQAAANKGANTCYVGIGGSATNDGGFGMARALGWKFLNKDGAEITQWTSLTSLVDIVAPRRKKLFRKVIVAVDVKNPLLGPKGCSRIYGPQKGLKLENFAPAEAALKQLALIVRKKLKRDFAKIPGAGAAGGLGFALMAFLGATPKPGFDIFAENAGLEKRLRQTDLVLTGEGALDQQTLMGKGVGQIALLCRKHKVPCIGLAGIVTEPKKARKLFNFARGLVEITSEDNAKADPTPFLSQISSQAAVEFFQ